MLRLYAILRGDLQMPIGKACSQAGHAVLDSFLISPPDIQRRYMADGHGTKVVLVAPDEESLRYALMDARDIGLPAALVVDSGHVMPPHFDGNPIVTALGIGPCRREMVQHITERFALM